MARILMCPPDYFGIEYEINPILETWQKLVESTRARIN